MANVTFTSRYALVALLFAAASMEFAIADGVWPEPPATNSAGRRNGSFSFTTKAYHDEAFKLVLQEVNQVAKTMKLETDLPLTSSNIVRSFISPYGYARVRRGIGTITTSNFCYYISEDLKFSYIENPRQPEVCREYQRLYTWPTNKIDFQEARRQAEQWLALASMDVEGLNRDCKCTISLDSDYVFPPKGQFVPVYWLSWGRDGQTIGNVASVRLFTPTKALLQLRVEESKYILRKPLAFTNLSELISKP